ncbi:hypothetical protein ACLB2K_077605 [Fragaria x ananassa]
MIEMFSFDLFLRVRGVYSAKRGYRRIVKEQGKGSSKHSSSHMIDAKLWKVMWRPAMLPKISNFLWRALSNALSTKWNIFRRKIIPNPMCAICGEHPETIEHCLLLCPWTSAVWFGSSLRYIPEKASITSLDVWLVAVYSNYGKLSHDNEEFFQFVCFHLWEIWKQRCVVVMKRVSPNLVTTIENIHISFKEWSEAQYDYDTPPDEPRRSTASKLWHPPPLNVVKINIDVAWKTSKRHSGIGLVVRNHRGCSIAGASLLCSHNSVVEVETDFVVKGLQIARFLNLKNVIIEGDYQEVMRSLSSPAFTPNWKTLPILNRVKFLLPAFDEVLWNWVPHEANRVADAAAKLAMARLCFLDWANTPPTSLLHILRSDDPPE